MVTGIGFPVACRFPLHIVVCHQAGLAAFRVYEALIGIIGTFPFQVLPARAVAAAMAFGRHAVPAWNFAGIFGSGLFSGFLCHYKIVLSVQLVNGSMDMPSSARNDAFLLWASGRNKSAALPAWCIKGIAAVVWRGYAPLHQRKIARGPYPDSDM